MVFVKWKDEFVLNVEDVFFSVLSLIKGKNEKINVVVSMLVVLVILDLSFVCIKVVIWLMVFILCL